VPGMGANTSAAVTPRSRKLLRILLQLLFLIVIVLLVFWIVHGRNAKKAVVQTTSLNQLSSILNKSTQSQVSKGDYGAYQSSQALIAKKYIIENDLTHAEQVMNKVLATVPQNKITSQTYFTMVDLETAKKDIPAQKKYLQLLITRLKADGDSQGAAAEQKYLDSLK